LGVALATGEGVLFTVTDDVVFDTEQPALSVTVTLYTPACPVAMLEREGFCVVDEKLEGPLHEYVYGDAPPLGVAVRFSVLPAQIGLGVAPAVTARSLVTATEDVVPVPLQPFASVTVTLYTPPSGTAIDARAGFWFVELKLLGPLHEYV
jgi:hypothetical protein